jgi:CubicO group peptidase (beta-lactamase class C family)
MQVFLWPEKVGSGAPAGIFGWDGAAGSCIQMDTASRTSVVYTQHVRNCGMAYDTIHPTLREIVSGED